MWQIDPPEVDGDCLAAQSATSFIHEPACGSWKGYQRVNTSTGNAILPASATK
jgi:hypothetical protein